MSLLLFLVAPRRVAALQPCTTAMPYQPRFLLPVPRHAVHLGIWLGALAALPTGTYASINDLDGIWQGTLACSEMRASNGRQDSPAFNAPLAVTVSMGAMTARRENVRITETYQGSVQRSGKASLDASGRRRDGAGQPWRLRLTGQQTGNSMALSGPLETSDGKQMLRQCTLSLALPHATPSPAAAAPRPPGAGGVVSGSAPRAAAPTAPAPRPAPGASPSPVPPQTPLAESQSAQRKAQEQEATRQAAEKAATDKRALEKAAAEKAAEEQAASAKAAAEKSAADKRAAEKLAADKAAAEKAAADKRAAEVQKAPIRARSSMDL